MSIKGKLKKAINQTKSNSLMLNNIHADCGMVMNNDGTAKLSRINIWLNGVMAITLLIIFVILSVSIMSEKTRKTIDSIVSYVVLGMGQEGSQVQFKTEDSVVVEQTALNQPAEVLLLGDDYTNQNIDECILSAVNTAEDLGMIESGDSINIATFVQLKNGDIMKSSLYKDLNFASGKIAEKFTIENQIFAKNDLLKKVCDKYACSTALINSKNMDELIKIYANYDKVITGNFNYEINQQLNSLWQTKMLELEGNEHYVDYKKLSNSLDIVYNNLVLLQSEYDENVYLNLEQIIDKVNSSFGGMLGEGAVSEEFIKEVATQRELAKKELLKIEQQYFDAYEVQRVAFKKDLLQMLKKDNQNIAKNYVGNSNLECVSKFTSNSLLNVA